MGTYNLPRNVKGEGRILYIFSTKALIYTAIGIVVGLPLYFIFAAFSMMAIGIIAAGFCGAIGFFIGTFKIPTIGSIKATKTVGGENIDDIIKRAVLFKRKGRKLYLYTKEDEK